MPRRRLLWQLYPLYLVVIVAAFVTASLFAGRTLRAFHRDYAARDLTSRAALAAQVIADHLDRDDPAELEALCVRLGKESENRITVIRTDGSVLAESTRDPTNMENHARRPEVAAALAGQPGFSERYSNTARDRMMYAAVPIKEDGSVVAVVRTSISASLLDASIRTLQRQMAWTGALIGVVVFLLVAYQLRRLSRPLLEVKRGAMQFAAGELGFRIPVPDNEEIGNLADTLNQMASQLSERIDTIVRQRNEQQAVLGSMVEGVIAIDTGERILQLNRAASELVGVPASVVQGRSVREMIRIPELQKMTELTLATGEPTEGEIVWYGVGERYIQVHVTPLRDGAGASIGALMVLNDVTRLRKLERVRRDFVANVSHELKTPLTSIKGFVETLLDGAIDQPDEARRFLAILAKQVERLQAILEDLLSLSRVEQDAERGEIELQDGSIEDVLRSAVQICNAQLGVKNIAATVDCPPSARARINPALLEQAAVNLIDNAIKYSEPGRSLHIEVRGGEREWAIRFVDKGCGIEAQHLDRIFERFYRVDKARSRKEGGTGLGLAIVKHIMAAHGGRATAESTPGQGSVFTLYLPLS